MRWMPQPGGGPSAGRPWWSSPTAAPPLRIARPGHAVLHWRTPRVTVVDTVGAGDSLAADPPTRAELAAARADR